MQTTICVVRSFPLCANKLEGVLCADLYMFTSVCEMVVCHANVYSSGLGISRFLASFACQRIKGVLKKSLVIDGSHAISVASFASGDARIARGRLKCMITAHPSFTRVFFQQHANNQEIDTIANCHATFQYIARRLGRLGDGRSART